MPFQRADLPKCEAASTHLPGVLERLAPRGLVVLWLVVLVLDALALLALPRLGFDDGLDTAFESQSTRYADHARLRERFTQSDDDVVALFRGSDFADPHDLAAVSEFVIEARLVEGVSDVVSVFSLRARPGGDGPGEPLVPVELPARADLASIIDNLNARTPDGARLVSSDRRLTAAVIALDTKGSGADRSAATLAAIEALARSAVEGRAITVAITGSPAIRAETVSGLLRDVVVLNGIGMIVGTIVCIAAMRSVALAMLASLTAGTALLWALGALAWLGLQINVVTVAVPLLVIVLVLSDGLHLLFEARRQRAQGGSFTGAAMLAVSRVGPACAIASATTALAFCGLLLSESILIRELGMAGVVGTTVSLLAALIVLPLLFVAFGQVAPRAAEAAMHPARFYAASAWRTLPAIALRHPRRVVASALVAFVGSMALYATVEPAYSLKENLPPEIQARMAMEEIDRSLLSVDTIDVPVTLDAGPADPASLARVDAVHDVAAGMAGAAVVVSAATLVPPRDGEDPQTRAARLSNAFGQMPATARGRFVSADGSEALVRIHMRDRGAAGNRVFVGQLETALAGTYAGRPTGFLVMSSFVSAEMISDLNRSFLAAVAMSGVIVVLWFRSLRYGLVTLLPNILPIALIGAWLALSGRGLQFVSGIALTIAFGIAVDDTVHVLNRLRLNTEPGAPFEPEAIARSMDEVAPVLVITTAVLSFGLVGTFFSTTAMTAYFGGLAIAVFLLAILADLLVLPASLRLLHRPSFEETAERPA